MGKATTNIQNGGALVSATNALPVAINIGSAEISSTNPVPVVGLVTNPTGSFTRPSDTTQYAVGDLVANSTTAGSVAAVSLTVARAAAGSSMLRRLKLHKSSTSTTSASFRVHLYRPGVTITCANGDNGAFSTDQVANYIGAFDVTIDRAFTDGAAGIGLPVVGSDINLKLASGTTVQALMEARATYTPTSAEVFTITLDDLPN